MNIGLEYKEYLGFGLIHIQYRQSLLQLITFVLWDKEHLSSYSNRVGAF